MKKETISMSMLVVEFFVGMDSLVKMSLWFYFKTTLSG
jgi:hypothetical protein